MKSFIPSFAYSFLAVFVTYPVCKADVILAFDIRVQSPVVSVGDEVEWAAFVEVTSSDDRNYGIATATFTLEDSLGEVLRPATIGSAFGGYFPSGGTLFDGRLIEIGASAFVQNDGNVKGADAVRVSGSSLGEFLLASGSFVATAEGLHALTASGIDSSENQFFTGTGQINGLGSSLYDRVDFGGATFTVNAVPEPGNIGFFMLGAFVLRHRRRSHRYSNRSQFR